MKQTIDKSLFIQAFENHDRVDNFTYAGLEALFDYLEDLEQDLGDDIEMDVVALCCEFSHYSSIQEAMKEYDIDSEDALMDNTIVIKLDDGAVIIQSF